ncbi:MAG: hypothetical protein KI792_12200 [Alphaproteobacteria bacterium]|nr:hypothetical protein [Alphaproteobacteria bacterium SS10]
MVFHKFKAGSSDRHHFEFTPRVLEEAVVAAGFGISLLETHDDKPMFRQSRPNDYAAIEALVADRGFHKEHRERRIYIIGENTGKATNRYPPNLYV